MRFELLRNDEGRTTGVRLRLRGSDVSAAEGADSPEGSRWRVLLGPVRLLARMARASVPRPQLRRNETGQVGALALRFGEPAAAIAVPAGAMRRPSRQAWVIEPTENDLSSRVRELWQYRGILKFSARRSLSRLTRGMATGPLWLFVRPLMPIIISTVVFGSLLDVPSDNVPYFLFFLTGTAVWMLFERSILFVTRSLDQNKGLIRKVYFPRLVVPIAAVAPSAIETIVYAALFAGAIGYYLVAEGTWYLRTDSALLVAPLVIVLSIIYAIAIGLWTSVWQTRFREVRYTLRYFMRFWHYLTPVLYPLSQVPTEYQWVIFLNPMAPLVETFKWSLLGIGQLHLTALMSATGVIGLTVLSGVWYFTAVESSSVDRM